MIHALKLLLFLIVSFFAPDARYSYHGDHLGSVRFLTDETGTVVNEYDYDSYGRPEILQESVAQPFLYTGREWDPQVELYHYRARVYDPSTGRFLQEDPIWFGAGDLNVQRYVWNNPLNWTDPTGLVAATERGIIDDKTSGGLAVEAIIVADKIACTMDILSSAMTVALEVAGQESIGGAGLAGLAVDAASCATIPRLRKARPRTCPRKRFPAMLLGALFSFPEDTPIITDNGYVAIQDLRVGDLVLSRDEETGDTVFAPVTELFSRMTTEMTVLTLETGEQTRTLRLTPAEAGHGRGRWINCPDQSYRPGFRRWPADRDCPRPHATGAGDAAVSTPRNAGS